MTPLPYTSSGARIAFYVPLVLFLVLEFRVRVRSRLNPHGASADRGSFIAVYVAIAGGMVGAFLLAGHLHAAAITVARWPLFVLGIALMVLGVVIRQWAVAVLGRFFTVDVRVHSDQAVVEAGPYRWVRHPSYTGLIMTLIGIGLALGNWVALIVLAVVPTAGLIVRIRVEEQALLQGLGEPYRRFAASRARLVPGVW